jgi:hypothetical protein
MQLADNGKSTSVAEATDLLAKMREFGIDVRVQTDVDADALRGVIVGLAFWTLVNSVLLVVCAAEIYFFAK